MLSRNLRRALLDPRWPIPPTFLLPWAANLTTSSHTAATDIGSPPIPPSKTPLSSASRTETPASAANSNGAAVDAQALPPPNSGTPVLSSSVRELLPVLKAQGPHYITAHIHGRPYLVTQGDTIKLPFHMPNVEAGDVIRLNRAVNLGSRDFTMKAAAAGPRLKSPTMDTTSVLDAVNSHLSSTSRVMPGPASADGPSATLSAGGAVQYAPHFIPNIAKGKHGYLDERLFVCRAVVMAVDSEPLRIKEKTKRRRRHVQRVKSKHKFTFLKVKELRIRGVAEMDAMADGEEVD